jgi:phage major head subunit gpT-like protein
MDVNRANLEAMFQSYSTAWQQGLSFVPPVDLSFLMRDFPSNSAANFYAFLQKIPGFRVWVGDRVFNNVRSADFQVVNKLFEDSVQVPFVDIEDDNYGVYAPIVQMMAEAWALQKYELVIEVLTSNPKAFDGKDFFATTHKYGEGATFSNKTTDALSATSFEAAFTAVAAWQGNDKKPLKPRFTHLLHGPALRTTAFNIVDADKVSDDSDNLVSNPNYKRCERVELHDLVGTYANYWFLVDGSRPVKAICRQVRREAAPKADTDPMQVERTGQFDVLASGRAAAGPAFPHMIYGGIVAAG